MKWYMARPRKLSVTTAVALALWCLALGYGFWRMTRYNLTPGARAASPAAWPGSTIDSRLRIDRVGSKTLLLFAHPQCPCTRATVGNLATILAQGNAASVKTTVVLFEPSSHVAAGWEQSDLVRSAAKLPYASVVFDPGGALARRFGAETSGQVMLYDAGGRLLFSGGVTDERGHAGDSIGGDALSAIISGDAPKMRSTPVYGCALLPASGARPNFSIGGMQMASPDGHVGSKER